MCITTGLQLSKTQWIVCPGHAAVCDNECVDKLASSVAIAGGMTLDPPTVLLMMLDYLAKLNGRGILHQGCVGGEESEACCGSEE